MHTLGILSTTQPNGLAVPDATMYPVKETSDVLHLMDVGLKNRAKGSTALNERSSRSHRFFNLIFFFSFFIFIIFIVLLEVNREGSIFVVAAL